MILLIMDKNFVSLQIDSSHESVGCKNVGTISNKEHNSIYSR